MLLLLLLLFFAAVTVIAAAEIATPNTYTTCCRIIYHTWITRIQIYTGGAGEDREFLKASELQHVFEGW